MKVSASALLAVAALAGTAAAQWCPTTTVRKEFRQMTNNERQRYFSAVRQLNSGSRPNQFDRFAQVHVWFANEIHGVAPFLVWHRQFVRDWEQTLQRVSGDSSVFQPYWDWTNDSQNPAGSPIFSGNWLGGDGRGGCANIPMLGGQVPVWWDGNYQQYQHCLTRNFNREVMRAFYPRSALQVVFDQSRDYARLNPGIEIGPHSNVHVAVGGHMNSMASPNDPVFWFHHAFIDKLWNDWVNVDYNNRLWSYGGPNRNGASASYNDRLPYYGMQVWTVMPLGNMCYNY
ncbi:Di-copper centre-containing protein, partial [Ramicandelaber brevisporus]